jgi:DNA-binding MarR family transcriptional regulator
MEQLDDIIFYTLDRAIRAYRQFAQKHIAEAGFDITIDQWLVLKAIQEDNTVTQQQIASKVFKDFASVTRIIELLVAKKYLLRDFHLADRRRFALSLTEQGNNVIQKLRPYTAENRKTALNGLSKNEIENLQATLSKIISNVI